MTRIYYTLGGQFVGSDTVNRVLTPEEIEKYIRRARREIGKNVEHKITIER